MIYKEHETIFDNGVFKESFLKFIAYKQSLGFKYSRRVQCALKNLNTKLNTYKLDAPVLLKETVETLVCRREHESPATQNKRICLLRHFAGFLQEMGYEAYIYPEHCKTIHHEYFAPYIFTEQQIASIVKTSDSLPFMTRTPMYHIVWPAIIRVLYGCGLRLSEALSLKVKNVNLNSGTLYIEKSKNWTSRLVPMSPSLNRYMVNYMSIVNLEPRSDTYFFPAPDGGCYAVNTAYSQIKRIYEEAGIPRLSNGRLPRIHDLRHTYCCHALKQMQENGFDLYYSLPILSAYLGHQGIRDTEKYLRLPIFQHPAVVEAETAILGDIIPEVNYYEEA